MTTVCGAARQLNFLDAAEFRDVALHSQRVWLEYVLPSTLRLSSAQTASVWRMRYRTQDLAITTRVVGKQSRGFEYLRQRKSYKMGVVLLSPRFLFLFPYPETKTKTKNLLVKHTSLSHDTVVLFASVSFLSSHTLIKSSSQTHSASFHHDLLFRQSPFPIHIFDEVNIDHLFHRFFRQIGIPITAAAD